MDGAQAATASAAAHEASRPQVDDWSALLIYHQNKTRSLQPEVDRLAALLKAARDDVNAAVEIGATDLGVTNEKFLEWLKKGKSDVVELTAERELDDRAYKAMGKLVQADLFAGQDTAAEQAVWFHRGYQDGVDGADQRPDVDPIFLQTYLQGWLAGQAVLAVSMTRGKELADQRQQPNTAPAVNLNIGDGGEGEGDEPDSGEGLGDDDRATLDAQADKLKGSGFLETESGAGTRAKAAGGIKLEGQAKRAAEKAKVH